MAEPCPRKLCWRIASSLAYAIHDKRFRRLARYFYGPNEACSMYSEKNNGYSRRGLSPLDIEERRPAKCGGAERSGARRSGAERSGEERTAPERNGAEQNGVEPR